MQQSLDQVRIRLMGLGGHGIVFAGRLLGMAAAMQGLDSILTITYSPEQRGGWSRADVIIAKEMVDYPLIDEADVFLATTQQAFSLEFKSLRKGGIFVYESTIYKPVIPNANDYVVIPVPATEIAENVTGRRLMMNVVLVGVITSALEPLIKEESVINAIRGMTRRAGKLDTTVQEMNIKAFQAGLDYGRKYLKGMG
ncbi:pyruvate oxidoreductase [Vulcanisaeta sp. EB80]|jgi:Pyruvate:ferredoxin oxidoreductase and related 2-oxoacid:ferredoxin oxidoreductases, gamma subunit|uniref:2-oxoacid:acceptor oxidoreductase family protein n=1 Tax=Vulcanisaeta sp. EB80 TaxID=1650660 RepID=UPI00074AFAF7|nr:2-oxoacid:acceptor oxidoreductase family protein [Vulcanisaeta sp. EB80]KUO79841.1 MAG: pyruvate oxidoreductase [Vulcanisaeta sp. JCHS_4]MDT7864244.1 2-oxoacid:acceptor oxidoreductase family protein [Vulcanisaeta sp.]PLC68906.1 pyruvate oxidoreductase [Vulcanisaeta sp. EB80]